MTMTVKPKLDNTIPSELLKGGIQKVLEKTGKLPPVSLVITPLDGSGSIYLDRFLTYSFNSSILIPVDTFQFNAVVPDGAPFYSKIKEGDIVTIFANSVPLATGIIDTVDTEVDNEYGEKIMISGRDLLSQFEDQDAISVFDLPIYGNNYTVDQAINALIPNTRINGFRKQQAPKGAYLFATEPGENKLSALQRFLEPLNCIFWSDPNGRLVIGRPNMAQGPIGSFIMSKEKRKSNVLSIKSIRSSTNIPNIIVPVWTGQESVVARVPPSQRLLNKAPGPSRLLKLSHFVAKTVVVSTPQAANSAQALSDINQIKVGGSNLLQAHAKREAARHNHKEHIVQVVIPGHYNESGTPYQVDQVYHIEFDRGLVDENMYLFQVQYDLSEESGQKTSLYFCKKGTIVSDVRAQ